MSAFKVILLFLLLSANIAEAFIPRPAVFFDHPARSGAPSSGTTVVHHHNHRSPLCFVRLSMVRNIDLPEALVFYGWNVFLDDDEATELRTGVQNLLDECKDVDTPIVVVVHADDQKTKEVMIPIDLPSHVTIHSTSASPPPNPRALYESINALSIQPRSFGGSSGFGRRQWDEPARPPLFKHVVVLCDCEEVCRAARYLGTRVLSLSDNDLADAVLFEWDEIVSLEDIATPGSFWLNPPHPRDDDGNRVADIQDVIDMYELGSSGDKRDPSFSSSPAAPTMTEDEMSRILADLDSLQ
jgi:hypothetical protein